MLVVAHFVILGSGKGVRLVLWNACEWELRLIEVHGREVLIWNRFSVALMFMDFDVDYTVTGSSCGF